ncbi:MAG: deoxyribonuclease V [Candidatus Latescibacterota bacterium]|nr:MAG: deoxyribonuclease V [Candidatus Latescibacterota bacterium]
MNPPSHHNWNLDYRQAVTLQERLAKKVRLRALPLRKTRFVAGADIAVSKRLEMLVGAIAVLTFPDLELVEKRFAKRKIAFPYIPGLLSFREIPVLITCVQKVKTPFDVMLCDGQGIAHPRGLGLASHLGLLIRKPTIGCAKSLLVGKFGEVGNTRGAHSPLVFNGKRVGSVLRTRDGVKPVFVSPGHLADHAGSRRMILSCANRYRLPEPIRHADRLAGEEKRRLEARRSR